MEEKLRGGDRKIKACLMVDTLRQARRRGAWRAHGEGICRSRGRRLSRALPARPRLGRLRHGLACAARRTNRRASDRAQGDDRRRRILDRRADRGGAAGACPALPLISSAARWSTPKPRVRRCSASATQRCRACGRRRKPIRAARGAASRERLGATWGIGETGATGPTGNRYGDAAGHTCIAVSVPSERAITLETGSADRRANMDAFAKRALELIVEMRSG